MKFRVAFVLAACMVPAVCGAWVELGTKYIGALTVFQLGDICDSTRFPLTHGDCSGSDGNPDWRTEITEAMDRWHGATQNFQFVTDPGAGASIPGECEPGDPNSLFFLDDICGLADFGTTTLAVALTSFFFDGVALHSDVIFNETFEWDAFDDALTNHGDFIDFTRVAVHELGHVAGLGHPFHELGIMSPFIQDVVIAPQPDDIAGMNAIYGVSLAFAIPDQNGNLTDELVHVWRAATGETLASIRDSSSGAILMDLTYFTSGFQTVDATLIPDEDGDGAPELAVLGIRMFDLKPIVQIKNITGAENARSIGFSGNLTPLRLKNIGDADGNGVSELAVLAVRETDLRAVVEIRNAFGPVQQRAILFEGAASPIDIDVRVDPLGIVSPRITALMFKWPSTIAGRGFLDSRNAFGTQNRTKVYLRPGTTPVSLTVIDEGGPQIAALSTRDSDGRTLVEIKNVDGTGGSSFQFFNGANSAINVSSAGDADGDGHADIIVISRSSTDGRAIAEVRNTDGTNRRQLSFASTFDPVGSVFMLNDTDGDTFPEFGTLLSNRAFARAAVYRRNAAGPDPVTSTRIWVSPTP